MGDPGCLVEAVGVEKGPAFREEGNVGAGPSSVPCSICLELVSADPTDRSIVKLQCGHEFHLDCIGSAFNAKGVMQCPNCRKVEKGQWLYANGYRSFSDFNVEDLVTGDLSDLNYSEMPFGFHWCPFCGFTRLASLFEEGEIQTGAYHDLLRSAALGDSGASEPQYHNWQQQPSASFSVLGAGNQSATHNMALRFPRDSTGQQRLSLRNGSVVVTAPDSPIVRATRGSHNRAHRGHTFQQSSSSSTIRNGAFLPIRRTCPRSLALISSIATSSSAGVGGFYRFSLSGPASGRHQDGESSGRHFDYSYGWGSDGFAPLPWVPVEGDPQWWSPFHPNNQNPQPGNGDSASRRYSQRGDMEGVLRGHPECAYQQAPFLRMPPFT